MFNFKYEYTLVNKEENNNTIDFEYNFYDDDENKYSVYFTCSKIYKLLNLKNVLEIAFSFSSKKEIGKEEKMELTGLYNGNKILSTVIFIITNNLKEIKNIENIIFSSYIYELSRIKLYFLLCKKYSNYENFRYKNFRYKKNKMFFIFEKVKLI